MKIKRIFDIVFSALGLVILSPLLLIVALAIAATSEDSFFYIQNRVGKNGKIFRMIKFRTMRIDSDKTGLFITAKNDPQITVIGKILRRTKLDELPELWNVLVGDMSLVGPRPEVPKYVKYYKPEWERVLSVRPGITDLATLPFRDEESVLLGAQDIERAYIDIVVPIKMKLALEYVDRRSFWLDFKILFLTVWGITLGRFFAKPSEELANIAATQIKRLKQTNVV